MSDKNITPVYVGNIASDDSGSLIPEVVSLEGEVRVRLVLASGEEFILPVEVLGLLGSNSMRLKREITICLEQARREEYHPSKRHDKESITHIKTFAQNQRGFSNRANKNEDYPTTYIKADGDFSKESTPYLVWKQNAEKMHGWALGLVGVTDINVGWAAWDDTEGVDELIATMSDVETCIAISGIVAPTETAQMVARLSASALRTGRKLPGINNTKVRKILSEGSGLASPPEISNWNASQIKSLTITSGDKKIPVAVAITAPNKFPNQKTLTPYELKDMEWSVRRKLEFDILEPLVKKWLVDAERTMIESGWRLLSLPMRTGYNDGLGKVLWFTLITPELWANVSAAANETARSFSMSRSTRI